jgi:SAM-dependent methyltransferase
MKATNTITTTAEQRIQQFQWRPWPAMLELVSTYLPQSPSPSSSSHSSITAIDMGCGTGDMVALMQQRHPTWNVLGLDQDPEMLASARHNHPDCTFCNNMSVSSGILSLDSIGLSHPVDMIWSSFTCQYFMHDMDKVLANWATLLKPSTGILVICETNGLFSNHRPQSPETIREWQDMEEQLRQQQYRYDCHAGHKLRNILERSNLFCVVEEQEWDGPEFAFNGPAPPYIIEAWRQRLRRMKFPKKYFGRDKLETMEREFLECLAREDHTSTTKLTLIVAKKKI